MNKHLSNRERLLNSYHAVLEEIREHEEIESLAISERIEVDIELSTGGPADGFKLYLDKETREPLLGCYYYSDWAWYEEEWLKLTEVDMIADYFGIM